MEQPIHRELAKKRVSEIFNVRLGQKVDRRLEGLISSAIYQGLIFQKEGFLWTNRSHTTRIRSHLGNTYRRKIEEIAPEEIALALKTIVKNSMSIDKDDLIKEVAVVFGFIRTTENISNNIQIIFQRLLSNNYLKQVNGRVSIVNSK